MAISLPLVLRLADITKVISCRGGRRDAGRRAGEQRSAATRRPSVCKNEDVSTQSIIPILVVGPMGHVTWL